MAKMGLTYFIADSQGYIKIGRAKKVVNRFKDLQLAHAMPLTLLAVVPDGSFEKLAHRRFQHLRIKGEWFEAGQDLTDFIESLDFKPLQEDEVISQARKDFLAIQARNRICYKCRNKANRIISDNCGIKAVCEKCHTVEVSGFVTKAKSLLQEGETE